MVVPRIKFNNGLTCPIIGLGTWNSQVGEVGRAIKAAIDTGYRHFDCAHIYGNEKEIGDALSDKFKEGKIKREDIFVTSKLWNTYHKKELVEPALRTTLNDLKLEYLDLYLIHWPMGFKEGGEKFPRDANDKILYSDSHFDETWKAMENCVKKGLTKSIGLSNFSIKQIEEILSIAEIKPVNIQVECHPYLNQEKLIEFTKLHGLTVTAYSPLGSPQRPMAKPGDLSVMSEPKVSELALKYKKSVSQILIKYQIQRNVIVIPKSTNEDRIKSNFDVFDFEISDEDMSVLNSLNKENGRLLVLDHLKDHKDYPFRV